jgi:hypothetical protein
VNERKPRLGGVKGIPPPKSRPKIGGVIIHAVAGVVDRGQPRARGRVCDMGSVAEPASDPPRPRPRLGGVKNIPGPGTTVGHGDCSYCEGRHVNGNWIHSARCPNTIILWYALGFKRSDWTGGMYRCCPWQCPGDELPSGVMHSWQCPFWDATGTTPPFGEAGPERALIEPYVPEA